MHLKESKEVVELNKNFQKMFHVHHGLGLCFCCFLFTWVNLHTCHVLLSTSCLSLDRLICFTCLSLVCPPLSIFLCICQFLSSHQSCISRLFPGPVFFFLFAWCRLSCLLLPTCLSQCGCIRVLTFFRP